MITIKAQNIAGNQVVLTLPNAKNLLIDEPGLTLLPALIDPHVHFRTPGMEHKEDWRTGAKAAIAGGYTTVFDMPNTLPPTITASRLDDKIKLIDSQLQDVEIPLHYRLFFGADKYHLSEIPLVKDRIIGIKVFMGSSTGDLVIDDDESLNAIFKLAAENNLIVAVHAEDEQLLKIRKAAYQEEMNYAAHSRIRDVEVARLAVEKAIGLTRLYGTRLYILHVSTLAELQLIRAAKEEGLPVYAEVTPHHLFLNEDAYQILAGKAQVNPPLRQSKHQIALFQAIQDGTIDTIGSDHAPHTSAEKAKPYGECPSGMPGIETTLPLLLNAYHQQLLTLDQIVSLTSTRAREIFNLPATDDWVLVDLAKKAEVSESHLKTKCGWSPFNGMMLQGWPVCTVLNNRCYELRTKMMPVKAGS